MKRLLLGVMLSLLLVGTASCVGYQDYTFDVPSLATTNMQIHMSMGQVLEGYLTVKGGDDDINFYAIEYYGEKVLEAAVKERYDFSYTAPSGFHDRSFDVTLYFNNTLSQLANKQVSIHYRVR